MTCGTPRRKDYRCRVGGFATVSDLPTATHVYDCVTDGAPAFPPNMQDARILRTVHGGGDCVVVVVENPDADLDRRIRHYYGQWFGDILCVQLSD